jgi:hypothetical protein
LIKPPGQIPINPVQRKIKSILHLAVKLVTEIGKKDFCVVAAMLSKALARSEANRAKFIKLPLDCAGAHVATEEAITPPSSWT